MIPVRIFIPALLFASSFTFITDDANLLPKDLQGSWQLSRLYTLQTEKPLSEYKVLFSIEEDGKVNGFSGCNRFNTTVKLRNDSLLFGTILSSRKFCEKEYMDVEDAFRDGLKRTTGYVCKNNVLFLFNGRKKIIQLIRQ